MSSVTESSSVKAHWLSALEGLVADVRAWCEPEGWVARRIDRKMDDPDLGEYLAPAMVMQRDFTKVMLEPICHSAPGIEGIVDIYLMPAYDDIGRLLHSDGQWQLLYTFGNKSSRAAAGLQEIVPLTQAHLHAVLEDMIKNANE